MKRLRKLRTKAGMSQKDLSKAVGCAPSAIGHWEQGIREPKLKTALKIADFFNVTPQYLVGWSDDPRA
ncbi:helix-turn-helix domain-containing protein [uncultured Lentilactobacillus sp.]|uniref:helix-turn-helix domain-containing protein n=1 Tax=uncultured Lentilactobacillus sp. TaxID=2805375 RepID=UPI00259224EA|nr:helix-turn-helix transcriptional regulator [uncultured Lentilactobacillus sp.]